MMDRTKFLIAVRSYLGTPFHHQGRLPGVGLDCAGVVVSALRECGYSVTDVNGYARTPAQGLFEQMVESHCDRITLGEVMAGDLMMFRFREDPQHIAVVSQVNPVYLIHGYEHVNKVVENSLDKTWLGRLTGCYRIRGIE